MLEERPHLAEKVRPHIEELRRQWDELDSTTKEKGEKLIEANRGELATPWGEDR